MIDFPRHMARAFLTSMLVVAAAGGCSPSGSPTGVVSVRDAWTMATPAGATVGAGYMTIANGSAVEVRLQGGTTPAAQTVEIHEMSMDGGVMRMRPMPEGVAIPAGGTVTLAPNGLHLMLIGLKQPLPEGGNVPLTLSFSNGSRLEVQLAVRAMGSGHGH